VTAPPEPEVITEKICSAPRRISYTREYLLNCSKSPLCAQPLPNWTNVARQFPAIARKVRITEAYSHLSPQCQAVRSIEPLVPPTEPEVPLETNDYLKIMEPPSRAYDLPTLSDSDNEKSDSLLFAQQDFNKKKLAFTMPKQSQRYKRTCDFETWDPDDAY
jgi:hypothetical protein